MLHGEDLTILASSVEGRRRGGVHSLPNELIAKIFQVLADDAIHESPTSPYYWITVTRVCRLWYDIAIECPLLWTFITPTVFPALDPVLSRSRDAPLTFMLDNFRYGGDMSCPSDRELGLSELHRIKHYELHASPDVSIRFIDHPHPLGAPQLQVLDLRMEGEMQDRVAGWNAPLPSLTDLSVYQLPAGLLHQLVSQNLQRLTLSFLAPRLPLPFFFQILADLPLLQYLHANSALRLDTRDVGSLPGAGVAPTSVRLQHLEEIYMNDTLPVTISLLDQLTLPINAETWICVDVSSEEEAAHLLASLRGNLSRRITGIGPMTITDMDVCVIRCRDWVQDFKLYPRDDMTSLATPQNETIGAAFSIHTFLDCDCEENVCGVARTMATLPSIFVLTRLRFLRLKLLTVDILMLFHDAFRQMTSLERLGLEDAVIAAAILELPQASHSDGMDSPIFPGLTSVVIRDSFDDVSQPREEVRKLYEVVARRRELPNIARLEEVHVCSAQPSKCRLEEVHVFTAEPPKGMYDELQGYCGIFARFEVQSN